jgi:prepilin-type N-terminal cleavage/methylation domain-containing protein
MSTTRAFNLIEVAVAMAIAGIIAAASVSVFGIINHQLVTVAASTRASNQARTVVAHLVARTQTVGGGALRPWDALVIEDAPAPARGPLPATTTTSRLWTAVAIAGASDCVVTSIAGDDVIVPASCCQQNYLSLDKGSGFCPPVHAVDALLVAGETRHQRTIQHATLHADAGTCALHTTPGPLAFADRGDVASLAGGTLSLARVRVVTVDESSHDLWEVTDRNADGTVALEESVVLAGNVHAFTVRAGFDEDGHGVVPETAWTRTVPSPDATLPALRAVELGLVVGARVPAGRPENTVRFDGRTFSVPRQRLEATTSRALLRSLLLFQH